MADYDTFAHGGVTFPLTDSTSNSLLEDADPVIYRALEFFQNQIETHLGDRWEAEVALTTLTGRPIVAYAIPYDPAPYLNTEQLKFPLLAVYRASTAFGERTATWRNDICKVHVAFVLPPLDAGQAERLLPILNGVKAVIDHQTEQGFYSTFTPADGDAGDDVWLLSGLEKIDVRNASFGSYETTSGLHFPSIVFDVDVHERVMPVDGAFGEFEGADVSEDLDNESGDEVVDFVEFATDVEVPEEGA